MEASTTLSGDWDNRQVLTEVQQEAGESTAAAYPRPAPAPTVQVERIRVLRGPNIWAYRPVLEIWIDIGRFEDLPSNELPGFTERLVALLPGLWEHRCSEGRPGGFLERLRMGTYMGHILEHIILELQGRAGIEASYGRTRGTGKRGEYRVVVAYRDEAAARMCLDLGLEIVQAIAAEPPQPLDLGPRIEAIREVAAENLLGPSTQAIVDAARRRGIPAMRLNAESLVQLGHGRYARRIQAAETARTANIAVEIASDKELTKALLARVGVPVPEGQIVRTVAEGWAAAEAIGGPVVVKPKDGSQGEAVSVDLRTQEQVEEAARLALATGPEAIVEQFYPGNDYRMLVVDGKLVAAALRRPAQVVGNGQDTIARLVERINQDPRRGSGHGSVLTRIRRDDAACLTLNKQGLSWDSVPEPGQVVLLRDNSNLSTGGTATDVTDEVHPDNRRIAELAARTIGLDIAGIDVVTPNIRRSMRTEGGGIVEVNAAPGLRMHLYPTEGQARPVGEAIVEMLFPKNAPARVPIIAITGTNGKTTVTRMIAAVFGVMHKVVGMTTTDGIYCANDLLVSGDCSGPRSAEAVLQHPDVEVAVLETARGGILRSGLGWDRCQVAVVTTVSNDHLGLDGVDTIEDLADVKQLIVERVLPGGCAVLNAEDPLVARMSKATKEKVIYFGRSRRGRVLSRHLANGGQAVFLCDGTITLAEGAMEIPLLPVAEIPATLGGKIGFQVMNALAAAAACWGAGCSLPAIRLGLRSFQPDEQTAPGRFNLFSIGPAQVILDYGHNPQALRAMREAVRALAPRRAIGVVGAPGDRRDSDIRELGQISAEMFDEIIIREDEDRRGREPGEVPRLIGEGIAATQPDLPITIIPQEADALQAAMERAGEGDLVVAFLDHVQPSIEQVRAYAAQVGGNGQGDAVKSTATPAGASKRIRLVRQDVPAEKATKSGAAPAGELPDGAD